MRAVTHRLAIDVGSSSVKLHAGRYSDGEFDFGEVARLDSHTKWEGGRHVWDVDALIEGIRDGIAQAAEQYGDIASLGIDATALDFGLLADGELLRNPYFYRDPSLWTTTNEVSEHCSERRAFELTGYNLSRGPIHYQLKEAPELFERADTLIPLPQLLSYELGAAPSIETSYAMTIQLLDNRTRTWSDKLIEALGFPRDILSDPLPAGTMVGSVEWEGSDGDQSTEPDIILPPSHDTAAAVGGLPLSDSNNAFLCTGSWFIPGLELPEPLVTDEVFEANGSNEIGVEGTTRLLRNLPGFSLLELCRDRWRQEGQTYDYGTLLNRVANMDLDAPLIDIRDSRFETAQFEGDVEETIRNYCKRTDQTPPSDEFEVTNCLLISLAAGAAVVLDRLMSVADESVDRVHLGGGGVRNEEFCQMFASAINRPVRAGPTEATALGNLLTQMWSASEIDDIEEGRDIVKENFDITEYEPRNQTKWAEIRNQLQILDGVA